MVVNKGDICPVTWNVLKILTTTRKHALLAALIVESAIFHAEIEFLTQSEQNKLRLFCFNPDLKGKSKSTFAAYLLLSLDNTRYD